MQKYLEKSYFVIPTQVDSLIPIILILREFDALFRDGT